MNTTLLHAEHTSNNPRHNLCWGTPELKLFEAVEDGKIIGKQLKLEYLILCMYEHICVHHFFAICLHAVVV
jgi:hypothetical protein